jgi:hypothetical protein
MAKTVGIGHQNFEEVVTEDIFYIDKSMVHHKLFG